MIQLKAPKEMKVPEISFSGITPQKFIQIKTYAKNLKAKHPNIKPDRLMRNVAKKFHVNLITE